MKQFTSRLPKFPVLRAVALLMSAWQLSSCGNFTSKGGMPARNEAYSFAGPGRDRVTRGEFPKIYFTEDSAKLMPEELKKLDAVIRHLRAHPEVKLLVAGFAHDVGTDEYNRVLGEQRAQAVREVLLDAGCAEESMQTLSMGSEQDAASGAEGRRVELGIVR
jgi:outer membrane protein OmpA-like peptidoglycan-associated protein